MPSIEYDLWYMRDGIEQLEQYLLSNEVYWPVSVQPPAGEPPYPQLTLGWLLLARKRVDVNAKNTDQQAEIVRLSKSLERIHNQWRSTWEHKAAQEFQSRLKLWRDYLEDYRKAPIENYDRYPYEVSRRVLLQILINETNDISPIEINLLAGLDQVLRAILMPGKFIWDEELEGGFEKDIYWFLYGELRKEPGLK